MNKSIGKRVVACTLAVMMVLQPMSWSYVYAGQIDVPENGLTQASDEFFVPLINGESTENAANLEVSYLEPLTLTLRDFTEEDGYVESIVFYCRSAESATSEWFEFSGGPCTLEPGQYILTYSYNDPDEYAVDGPDADFGFTVTKATVSEPSNIHWNVSDPAWTAPVTTTDGGALPADVIDKYTLITYKNGVEMDRFNAFDNGYPNFANHLASARYHEGVYTFQVEISVKNDKKDHFNATSTSSESPSFAVPLLKLKAGKGIESVQPTEKLLVPGDEDGVVIKATAKSGYSFTGWSGSGARFADSTAAETTVYIDEGYTGGTTLEITASAGDVTGPVITNFKRAGPGKLSAKAADAQDGVAAYAFSTETDSGNVDWTAVSPAVQDDTFEYTLTSGGTYYFYAKDAAGNVSRSEDTIQVTEVRYHDYYTEAGPKAYSDFIIGSTGVEVATPERSAYIFDGWFTDAELTTPAAETYTAHSSTPYELYAKWTPVVLPEITVEGVSRAYNGSETKLTPVMAEVDGTLSYSWEKDGVEVGTGRQFAVKNVADSGDYTLLVTLKDSEGNTVSTKTVENISVSITPAELTVRADNKTITYNSPAPEFTLTMTGLQGEDTKDVVTGTVSCDYEVGDSVGKYDIVLTDFSAANYSITTENGKLTVNAKEADLKVEFKDGTPSYTYEKDKSFEPEIVVTMGGNTLSPTDYEVAYTNNNKAGTATVSVTSEYFTEKTLTFEIAKAEFKPDVVMSGWKYGETKVSPALSEDHPEDGSVTWYYAEKDSSDFVTECPENAGDYKVYAVIGETDNYLGYETEKEEFTIEKRKIKLTANSASFVYDGLSHSDNGYEITGDGFVHGQNFYSITVTGSVTAVTPDDQEPNNIVTYTLTSNTLPGNYDIETVPGTLTVTKDTLPTPFNPHWDTAKPGTAVWVPVSKRDLTVKYHVELLAYDGTDYVKIGEKDTLNSSCDFSSDIRSHAASEAADGNAYSYFFTVKAMPDSGTNRDNYNESADSEETGEIFTAVISLAGENINSAKIADGSTYVLLSDESVSFEAKADTGYKFSVPATSISSSQVVIEGVSTDGDDEASVSGKAKAALTSSLTDVVLTFLTEDKAPEIVKAGYTNNTPYDEVTLSFKGTDELGLTDYVIKKGNETPAEGDWQEVPALLGVNRKEYTASLNVTEPGQYYAFFRDEAGNVTVSSECFTVYKYNFAPGAADVTGTMNPVLKEESQTITLPSETYERTGYSFKDWQSTAGIFEDGAKISANPKNGFEDTLTALWAGNQYSYTVNYYLMNLDGEYPAEAYKTKTFYAAYGAEESSDMDALSLDLTGFTRDDTKKEEITVTSNDQELNVYYSRNQYKLTRTYTEPGADEATVDVKSFYYEADLTDILSDSQKPKIDGYKFVGWFFGDAGSQPTTMPAMDVAASGYFTNEIVNYHINYYLQDLKADGTAASTYTINKSAAKTLTASYGDAISMDSDLAELPDGFSYASAFVTNEAYTDDTIALPEGAAETVSSTAAEGRTINVFLTRNTYTAKLNVWQGKVNSGNPIYTYSVNLLYGAEFPEDFANKNKDQWVAGDNYRLADYVGWSTESEPETMPAGDVTVTRQYVLKVTGTYKVRIYLETVDDGVYESPREFTFYENVGKNVSVGENESDTIKISDFASGVPYLQYYEFDEENEDNKLSGAVTDTNSGEDELVLSVYMNRKVMTSTISYYADNKLIATTTKSAKWGHTYHYDALSLFDVSEGGVWTEGETRGDLTFKGTVEGQNPDAYDFRNNNYVAIYSGHYVMNEKDNWPSKDFNSVASLSQNPEIIMGQSSNTATVRYSHVDPEEMYCLKIGYNSSALSHGQNLFVPLTYVDEEAGLNFTEIYAANEAYFFEDTTYVSDPAFSDYPGLGNYNLNNGKPNETTGRYFYDKDGDLKEGFSRVTINGKTYYQNGSALYIPVTANNLFVGKWTSYSIPTNEVGYQDVTDFLESYKAAWPNDPYAQGAYVYSRGWGSTVKYDTSTANLTVTFRNGNVYQISYNLGGTICKDASHKYAAGSSISSIGCDHSIIIPRDGYEVVWYSDSGFNNKPTLPFNLTEDRVFYGRYEKKVVKSTAYAYYETADQPEVGGKTYTYITEDDLDAFGEDIEVSTKTEEVDFTDEMNNIRKIELTEKTYTYNGNVVMVSKEIPSLTFTELEEGVDIFDPISGLHYDNANSKNILKGYVQYEGIDFAAYFVRDRYTLTVDRNIENTNVETAEYRVGQHITVESPTRDGYLFDGWTWDVTDYTEGEGNVSFAMPAANTTMTAKWKETDVNQQVFHFFQNHSGSYDKEATLAMLAEDGTPATLSLDGTQVDCLVYTNGGLSYESNGVRLYYVNATLDGGVYTIKQEDLAGSYKEFTALQGKEIDVADDAISVPHYSFAYAIYQYENDITRLEPDDSYTNRYGMILEYYYDLETFEIEAESLVLGGTEGTLSILGEGEYYYGKDATLKASMSAGYTFVGWYRTSDLPAEPTYDTLPTDKCISTDQSMSVRVTSDESYTAVMLASDVDKPTITISGDNSYRYNSPTDHVLTAVAEFGEDADPASYVSGYQWYLNGEAISGATGVNYKLPSDLDAGDYELYCEVTAQRKDNGVSEKVKSGIFKLTVEKDPLSGYTTAANHTAVYDAKNDHKITLEVKAPESNIYEIYYSTEQALTKDNYTEGVQTMPTFKDVKVDADGNVESYKVYYYVKATNDNYEDCSGSRTVKITPVQLTLSAGSSSYSKVYDGSATVSGSAGPDGEGTDLYKLTHSTGVYTINGLLASDTAKGYIISCGAEFNSSHTTDATAVTLADIVLADQAGNILHNYAFEKSYTVILSGYIERCPLELDWTNTEFDFNGETHKPTAAISGEIPSCDDGNLEVSVSGEQTYVGEWNAVAHLTSKDADTHVDDYSITNQSKTFKIKQKEISFAMVSDTVGYDGAKHTLSQSTITSGELVDGHSYTLSADSKYIHKGKYNIAPANVVITDAAGADVTENYKITCESTGELTINARTVTVSNIKAENKEYDGTTAAELTLSDIAFAGIIEGDTLSLDSDKVSGTFDTKDAGEGKTVNISYAAGALTGASASDYVLDTDQSQQTATADITKGEIVVKATAVATVYGEIPTFGASFSGFITGEDESVISGEVTYVVGSSRSSAAAYTGKEHKGTYNIYPVVTGLSADNYTFSTEDGNLIIAQRPVTVAAVDGALISKTYDGTTDVKTALVNGTHYEFAGVAGDAASGITNGDTVTLSYTAVYDEKDPLERTITVNGLSLDNDDYKLETESFTIDGEITRKTIKVTANKKTITYGAAAPTYTVSYSGFEHGENESVLSGTLAFACDYDTSDPSKRGVGKYTITPSGLTSDDYQIDFVDNELVVNPAKITLSTNTSADTLIYGSAGIPTFSYTPSGFKYDDDATVISIKDDTVNYIHGLTETEVEYDGSTHMVVTSVPDDYSVTLEMTRGGDPVFTATNYSFEAVPVTVSVTKAHLTIGSININSRVYDGTTNVYANQIDYSNIVTAGLLKVDRDYFDAQGASEMITLVNPKYNSKNVDEATTATFTIKYGKYLEDRYQPLNDQISASAVITKRPLTITANKTNVDYGETSAIYTVSYEKATATSGRGLVSGETADKTNVTITCGYTHDWNVGLYDDAIVLSDFTGSSTARLANYEPSYVPGDLEVIQKKLNTPAPVWDDSNPGVIKWNAVPSVYNVDVAGYSVKLMKDGAAVSDAGATQYVETGNPLEVNYLSLMRANGAGAYTVEVTAIASEVNNPDKENVEDSDAGKSAQKYAAKMIFSFAGDTITQKGKTSDITIQDEAEYVVIAGESGIDLKATLANATGYTIHAVGTEGSLSTVTIADPTDAARSGANFATTVALSNNHKSAADINIKLTLAARPATVSAIVKPAANGEGTVTNETVYGYSANTAPVFKVTCSDNDEVAPPSYSYSYEWELRTLRTVEKFSGDEYNKDTWTMPLGKKANTNASYYLVRCIVTATRSDNGQSVTLSQSFNEYASKYAEDNTLYNVIVNKADFTATVTMDGWTYGETPKSPVLHYDDAVSDNKGIESVEYWYAAKDSDDWSKTKPSDAGDYKVRAYVPASGDYNEYTTASVNFTIEKAKLAKPQNLTMSHSATADYGLISWDPVSGPKRDGTGTAVGVKYQVKLYKDGEATPFKTYDPISGCSMDVTADMQLGAKYKVELIAVSQDQANCMDSDSVFSDDLAVGATISVSGTGSLSGDTFTQKYDGTTITLTAVASGTASAYQWYENGEPLSGATASTYTLSHVAESGKYTCVVTIEGEDIHTPVMNVVVTKRSLKLTSGSDSKVYDGTALTKHEVTVGEDGFVDGEGMDYTFTGTATNVSDTKDNNNTFTAAFKSGTQATDYETPVIEYGTLTITAKEITLSETDYSYSAISDYVYDATAHTPEPTVTDNGRGENLVKNTDFTYSYDNNINAGEKTASVKITGKGNYKGNVTLNFTIKKRPVEFSAVSEHKEYTGNEIKINGLDVSSGTDEGLVSGHKHNVTFEAKGTEASATPYEGTITALSAVKITLADGTTDVTANYDITVNNGTLTIDKTTTAFTVTLPTDSYTYDANEHYNTKTASNTAKTGTTTYQYSFSPDKDYVASLSDLKKTDADAYTIYVRATNPNYENAATSTSTLTINKRKVKFSAVSEEHTYTGSEIQINGLDVGEEGLVSGHKHNVEFEAKGTEVNGSPYTGTITAKNDVRITLADGTTDVTKNYEITVNNGTLTINQTTDAFTVALADDSCTYDGQAHYNTKTASNTAKTGTTKYEYSFTNGSGYVDSLSKLTKTNAGTYTIYVKATNPNYANAATTTASLTINKRSVKFSAVSENKEYTGNEIKINGLDVSSGTDKGLVSGHKHNVKFEAKGTEASATPYDGTITAQSAVRITLADGTTDVTANYDISVENGSLTIDKTTENFTVSLADDSCTYDGQTHYNTKTPTTTAATGTTTYEYSFTNGSGYVGSLSQLTKTNAGTYTIYVKATNPNYVNAATTTASLTINKRPVKFSAVSENKEYTGNEIKINGLDVSSGTDKGLVSGHKHNVTFEAKGTEASATPYEGTITAQSAVRITLADGTTDVTANYDISVENGSLTIDKTTTAFTVALPTDSYTYDANEHYNTKTASNTAKTGTTKYEYSFTNGSGYVDSLSALKKTNAGTYTIYVKATNPNYANAATSTSTLTISKRQVKFSAVSEEHTYTGDEIKINGLDVSSGTDKGLVSGHKHNVTFEAKGTEASATPYDGEITALSDVRITLADGTTDVTANYDISVENGTLTINKTTEIFTVSLADDSCTYNGQTHYNTKTASNTAKTGTTKYEYSFTNGSGYVDSLTKLTKTNAGTYTIYVKATNPNYANAATTTASLTINPKNVTIDVQNGMKSFGQVDPPFTGNITGLVPGETLKNVVYKRTNTDEAVGKYTGVITATYDSDPNYSVKVNNADFEIIKASSLVVSGTDYNGIYDGNSHGNPVTVSKPDGATVWYSTDGGTTWTKDVPQIRDVGKITVTVKVDHTSYDTATCTYTLEVTPCSVQVKANAISKIYGNDDPELTVEKIGLIGTDDVTFDISRVAGETVGTYDIKVSGAADQGNYKVTFEGGTFTVNKRQVVLRWSGDEFFYDGEEKGVTAEVVNKVAKPQPQGQLLMASADPLDDVYVDSYNNNMAVSVGNYVAEALSISGADAGNYELANATHPWRIVNKPVVPDSKPGYGGDDEIAAGDDELYETEKSGKNGKLPSAGGKTCLWHLIMLAVDLVWLIAMVIAGRRSKEEDEEEREEQRKKSVRRYAVSEAGVSVILIILSILGFCKWDIPVALASIVVTAGAAVISHKHKFSEKSEETEA